MCLLALLATPAGAQRAGFAGTWVLDPSEGVLSDARPRQVELDIADDGQTLAVTERIRGSKKGPTYSCAEPATLARFTPRSSRDRPRQA